MRPKVGSGDGYLNDAGMTRAARRSDRLSAVFLIDCGDGLPDKSRFRAVALPGRSLVPERRVGTAVEAERRMEWSLLQQGRPDIPAQLAEVDEDLVASHRDFEDGKAGVGQRQPAL